MNSKDYYQNLSYIIELIFILSFPSFYLFYVDNPATEAYKQNRLIFKIIFTIYDGSVKSFRLRRTRRTNLEE